jgi:hypothetical protein
MICGVGVARALVVAVVVVVVDAEVLGVGDGRVMIGDVVLDCGRL